MTTALPKLTVGEAVQRFRATPAMRALIENCYLDEDFGRAADRFAASDEFNASLTLVRQAGIRAPSRVLDLGGGNGVAAVAWSRAGYPVVLLEPDASDVVGYRVLTGWRGPCEQKIPVASGIAESLPFGEAEFDLVYARQLMHHVSSLETVCREVRRVLKPNGVFLNVREHVISTREDLPAFLANHPTHQLTGGENAHLLEEYVTALATAGLRQIRVLGSWASPINRHPQTKTDFDVACRAWLAPRFGARMSQLLARIGLVQQVFGWKASQWDHTPGRMYTFLARR